MVVTLPMELMRLLKAADANDREAAWDALIAKHSRLLLAVSRSMGGSIDDAMDRYTYILGKLRESDFRRLKLFDESRGAAFTTWLAATSRNLGHDHYRSVFGRRTNQHSEGMDSVVAAARRALRDSTLNSEVDIESVLDETDTADLVMLRRHRDACLLAELASITARERLMLTLRFRDDLSASRIAKIVGLPTPFHVYRQIQSTLIRLRGRLEERGVSGKDG